MSDIKASLDLARDCIDTLLSDDQTLEVIDRIIQLFVTTFQHNNKILVCGNGGSCCDAIHFAEEFTGRFNKNRPALPVLALADPGHITCVANDFGFDAVFQRGVDAFGQENDVFLALTTSGNSQNIIRAFEQAQSKKMSTVIFNGKTGGALKGLADFEVFIPGKTSDRIQEVHMLVLHAIIEQVEKRLFPTLYS
ncbi:phosphoheptose isomerase [Candidatus Marinamargulisbacteria bacterium SCGC AG-333-B06]|nr:phosphoheptose isomerase [Candidatus Marinamargulisbacteria bacterium SCGC AG-333-B06]